MCFFSKMRQHCRNGRKVGKEIRDKIMDTPFQEDFEEELKDSWCNLWIQSGRCKRVDRKDLGYLKEKYKASQDGDTLPETNIVSENRPSQKEMTSLPTIDFQGLYMLVSGRVFVFFHAEVMSERCHQIKASVFLYCSYYH